MTEAEALKKQREIEAILFTMGDSVEADVICQALELEWEEFDDVMSALMKKYEDPSCGLQIIRLESAYQMCTKRECYDALIRVASTPVKPNLTGVMLEVLSIIAYRQPVTRAEIERIRGVSSDYAVNRLLDYGLIEEDGRAETIGRPILFKTTEAFLRQFGLSSAEDLPEIDEMIQDQAKENAYLEAGVTEEERKKLEEPEGEESSDMTAETDEYPEAERPETEHPEAERPETGELSGFDEHSETEAGSGAEGDPENNTDDASEEGSGLTGHLIPKSDDAE